MCIGEASLDTIGPQEQDDLRTAATADFPKHRFDVRANDEGIAWIVLEPASVKPGLPRVTICRIAPCLVIMIEDESGQRRFGSVEGVDDAMAFARSVLGQARRAAANTHPAHEVLQ